ncbi:type II toxin-antitoxin system YhaV family toxin [Geitlerinema sp. PCC 9228]|uniref:type II toxin-antitoxin system YhaV family toxin n=1 Tax=Geitlerinema sp. PCC 9228 TaxID=111611 RepID=UPI0008F9D1A2|nr:type II toxin-antitoxin system YhaV family toxin [Geitlerinema sp. PCC 9228]
MSVSNQNEWSIAYHPIFHRQYQEQIQKVKQLDRKTKEGQLSREKYKQHPDVKLLKALRKCFQDISADPFNSRYKLRKELKEYCRVKNLGLSSQYRLFFWVDRENHIVVILWLGYPRRRGDKKNDCYEKFKRMVKKGIFITNSEDLLDSDSE